MSKCVRMFYTVKYTHTYMQHSQHSRRKNASRAACATRTRLAGKYVQRTTIPATAAHSPRMPGIYVSKKNSVKTSVIRRDVWDYEHAHQDDRHMHISYIHAHTYVHAYIHECVRCQHDITTKVVHVLTHKHTPHTYTCMHACSHQSTRDSHYPS